MFLLKKLISPFFFPLSLVIALLLIGTFVERGRRKILLVGIALLYLFSFGPSSYLMLRPLESRYSPVSESTLHRDVRWIVVLGGGMRDGMIHTPEDRLEEDSLRRVTEGVRLARLLPGARLVLCGGNYYKDGPSLASAMNQVVLNQGLPRERVVLESASWDTRDQALFVRDRLGRTPFYLVTSASHMKRAMGMCQRLGSQPIAAPTDFHALRVRPLIAALYPRAEALADTENAFYEYLGLLWGMLRGYV